MMTKKERTRERILAVAYTLFARDGFSRVTMKDVCAATGLSRGGLYSHFSSTDAIFEAILDRLHQKDEMNFDREMAQQVPAGDILLRALELMVSEMQHPEDSLSLAMYEYARTVHGEAMERFGRINEEKWARLIEYGVRRGEFRDVSAHEMADVIFFAYQGVRMWSRVAPVPLDACRSITDHIRNQLFKE